MTPATQPIHHGGADSHLPLLLACVAATTGPVLEIGIGFVSTPVLHSVRGGRPLVSLEDSPACIDLLADYFVDGHEIYPDNPAVLADMATRYWSVVFIDDSPGGQPRADQVALFLPRADFVVMHDAQDTGDNYGPTMDVLWRTKANYTIHKRYFPWTLAASLTHQIPAIP